MVKYLPALKRVAWGKKYNKWEKLPMHSLKGSSKDSEYYQL